MKKYSLFATLALMVSLLSGCQVIGDLMKASFFAGIIVVLIVIFLIVWLISKFRN